MSVESRKALVRRFYEEVWDRGNLDVVDEVFAPDCVRHDLRPTTVPAGPEGQRQVAAAFRKAFPDLRFDAELVLGEGDYVVARWTATGTHTGPWGGVAPTGRAVRYTGVNIFRFADGRVAEIWNFRDDLGLREQLDATVFAGAPPTS